MSQPQPKTKAFDLLNQVIGLSLEAKKSALTLKRLEREAKSISSVDPVVSSMCLGIIFFYENKHEDVKQTFAKAIKRFPDSSILAHNYAVTLRKMGFYKESLQYADTAHRLSQADPAFLEMAYSTNILNGKFDVAHELSLMANKLHLNIGKITALNSILQFIRCNSIFSSDFLKLQDTAYDLAHSKKIFIMQPSLEICEDEDSMFLSYEIQLDKPVREIVDLNVMHAELLAKTPSLNDISDKINISFSPWCE